ncbi:hypothetical protein OPT61_g797 [Boeremia exigua]|uniref:Uncharacterized protein n=1 Tax=Boeremia exigua TaxID=749465 RepID=A0ACC2ISK2_9PLEO|nr:hypothetical protein OPT61_g797 [Boeremia exigua]
MSDTEPKTAGQGAATGAAWSDAERMAYLIVVAEHALDAPIESKVSAPVPGGRNVNACRKILKKLKDKLKDDIDSIKAGRPVSTPPAEGEVAAKGTPRKRRTEADADGDASPKKKATPRKKKSEAIVKDEDDEV